MNDDLPHPKPAIKLDALLPLAGSFTSPHEAHLFLSCKQELHDFFSSKVFVSGNEKMLARNYHLKMQRAMEEYCQHPSPAKDPSDMEAAIFMQVLGKQEPGLLEKINWAIDFMSNIQKSNPNYEQIFDFMECMAKGIFFRQLEMEAVLTENITWNDLKAHLARVENEYQFHQVDRIPEIEKMMKENPRDEALSFKALPVTQADYLKTFHTPLAAFMYHDLLVALNYRHVMQQGLSRQEPSCSKAIYLLLNHFLEGLIPLANEIEPGPDFPDSVFDTVSQVDYLLRSIFGHHLNAFLSRDMPTGTEPGTDLVQEELLKLHEFPLDELAEYYEEAYEDVFSSLGLDLESFMDTLLFNFPTFDTWVYYSPFKDVTFADFFAYQEVMKNPVPQEGLKEGPPQNRLWLVKA